MKRATSDDGVIARLYITGTASTVLNAVSSDFGIAWDLSEDSRFSSLFGFTETELRSLIPTVINPAVFGHSVDEEVDRMTKCLTAYQFCPFSRTTVFNPADCFYYIDSIKKIVIKNLNVPQTATLLKTSDDLLFAGSLILRKVRTYLPRRQCSPSKTECFVPNRPENSRHKETPS